MCFRDMLYFWQSTHVVDPKIDGKLEPAMYSLQEKYSSEIHVFA